jgi:hypothetical protein
MRLVALYKTWDGDEWIEASLASIYDHVDAIVMVHSEVSWLGELGNTVRGPALKWTDEHDTEKKIHHLNVNCTTQEEQYAEGCRYIRANIPFDAVLAIDSDEVWEGDYLEAGKEQFAKLRNVPAARCWMHTYIKTPFYRVDPPWGMPTVFFRDPEHLILSPRGCQAPAELLHDVWMHHYTYVRRSPDLVWRKIQQSCLADKDELIVENWMDRVYERLPLGRNIHAFVKWREVWHCIRQIWWSDLPKAVRECEFIKHWWPDGQLMDGEKNNLYDLARGRRMAVDLGTYKGLSAVILGLACERAHTIDAYEDVPEDAVADEPGDYARSFASNGHSLEATLELAKRFGNITAEKEFTCFAGGKWFSEHDRPCVDTLFVDADHSARETFNNVASWWPNLVNGARIIFHDDNDEHPGVREAVRGVPNAFSVRRLELGQYSGSLAAFEKVG